MLSLRYWQKLSSIKVDFKVLIYAEKQLCTVFRLEYLPYKKQKPFFGQTTHIEARLSGKSHFQLLFQIHLLTSNLKQILHLAYEGTLLVLQNVNDNFTSKAEFLYAVTINKLVQEIWTNAHEMRESL